MTTFTNVFGGSTVQTSEVSHRAFTIAANTTLSQQGELSNGTDVVADIMDITASAGSLTLRLIAANVVGKGAAYLINNVGAESFTLADNAGGGIATIAAGEEWYVYVADNATAAGTWRAVQFGSTTSSASAAALAGAGIYAAGSLLAQDIQTDTFNGTYTAGTGDRARLRIWTGGSGTLGLAAPATVGEGWFMYVRNGGSGTLTIDPASTNTIDAETTIVLQPGDACMVFTDGSAYHTVGLGRDAEYAFTILAVDVAGTGDYTLATVQQNKTVYTLTGTLTGNRNLITPTTVQQYWIDNDTAGAYSMTVKTASGAGVVVAQGQRAILYCDGTDILDADTAGVSTPIAVADGGTGGTTQSAARTNLGATSVGAALFTAASAAAGRTELGSTTIGDALFITASASAARTTLGASAVGASLFTVADAATALTTIGAAALASPALTGNPTATTQSPGNNSTRLATTAFVTAAITAGASGLTGLTGDVTASGTGSVAATIAAGAVTFAKIATAAVATAAEYQADTASKLLSADIVWDAALVETLTYGASYTPDLNTFINGTMTLTGNLTLNNPTNKKPGQSGAIVLVQDGGGSRTLSLGTDWKFPASTSETLTTTGGATDILFYTVITTSFIACSLAKGYA